MMANETILLVEDETDLLLNNKEYLEKQGYGIKIAETLKAASETLKTTQIDLILLDINMPDGSGLDYIHKFRETSDVPVIFLTCRTSKEDMIEGLTGGGCDYITKPYDLDVLGVRIEVQLRKVRPISETRLVFGALTIDIITQCAYLDGKDALLTPKEFALLLLFVQNPGKEYTADELYTAVWGLDANNDTRTVQVRISGLRRKLNMKRKDTINIEMMERRFYRLIFCS